MKSHIEIVTGFLGSGKTSFINFLVNSTLVSNEKIIVIHCEKGEKSLDNNIETNPQVIINFYPPTQALTEEYIKHLLYLHKPHRIIIEANGTSPLDKLLNILGKKSLRKFCKITTIYYITDAKTFNVYFNNMLNIFLPSIQFSNLILINNTEQIDKKELDSIKSKLDLLNPYAYLIEINKINLMSSIIGKMNILDNGLQKKLRIFIKNLLYK